MPFGLSTAQSQFQRIIEGIVGNICSTNILIFRDAFLIATLNKKKFVGLVLKTLIKHNSQGKSLKCEFLRSTISYLGFVPTHDKVTPTIDSMNNVNALKTPKPSKRFQFFSGL
jgi:hypothetical protein